MSQSKKIAVLVLGVFWAGVSQAGCWVEWQGINSRVVCDSAGAMPTFAKLKKTIRDFQNLKPSCKRAMERTVTQYFTCGAAVVTAAKTGGTVWIGAAEVCRVFSRDLRYMQEQCKERINLRTKNAGKMIRVCNKTRHNKLYVSVGSYYKGRRFLADGWFHVRKNKCVNTKRFAHGGWAHATTDTRENRGITWRRTAINRNSPCVNQKYRFTRLSSAACVHSSNPNLVNADFGQLFRGGNGGTYTWNLVD